MANLLMLLLKHPLRSFLFSYSFATQVVLALVRRIVLPHFPVYQSFRLQIQRAYQSSAALTFPDLPHRLPVSGMPVDRARKVSGAPAYLVPGGKDLASFTHKSATLQRCVILFAHGGGYARGEARMYVNYMERWVKVAEDAKLDLVFMTVEYRMCVPLSPDNVLTLSHQALSTEESHPAQLNSMIECYRYLLDRGIKPQNIVFMGDSAGGNVQTRPPEDNLLKQ